MLADIGSFWQFMNYIMARLHSRVLYTSSDHDVCCWKVRVVTAAAVLAAAAPPWCFLVVVKERAKK